VSTLLEPKDERWFDFLKRVDSYDVYHTPEYVTLCGTNEAGKPCAVLFKDSEGFEFLLPLLLREVPAKVVASSVVNNGSGLSQKEDVRYYDATSPYGYPGPLVIAPKDNASKEAIATALQRFQPKLKADLSSLGVVSLFVRLHPILNPIDSFRSVWGNLSVPTETVYIDLTQPTQILYSQMNKSHRSGMKKLRNMGFTTVVNDFSLLPGFVSMYHHTMARVDADENYYFPLSYFEDLKKAFGDAFVMVLTLSPTNEIAAGGIFLEQGDFVQFHLSASAQTYREHAPGKICAEAAMLYFKERGRKNLHFGGGVGGQTDSLFVYKSRFSPLRGNFQVWKTVVNQELFCQFAGLKSVEDSVYSGYFPPYRCPVR
jgi:hypothetical protein